MKTNTKQREKSGVNVFKWTARWWPDDCPMMVTMTSRPKQRTSIKTTPFCMLTLNVTWVFLFDHCRLEISYIRLNLVCEYPADAYSVICIKIIFVKTFLYSIWSPFYTKTASDALAQMRRISNEYISCCICDIFLFRYLL